MNSKIVYAKKRSWAHGPWAHGAMGPWDHGPGARARAGPGRGRFFGVLGGPYLAPPRNLPLGELIDTSFGLVRGPIRPETMFLEGPVVLETQGFGDPGNLEFWSQDFVGDFRCVF